jgi:hypothetical protein
MADQSQQPFASQLIAGDDWSWTIALRDYPASTYTLKYFLRGPVAGASLDLVASAAPNGSDFLLTATADQTKNLGPGTYGWQQRVWDSDDKCTELARGTVQILADIASQTAPYDARSDVKVQLDNVRSLIRQTTARIEQEYTTPGGRHMLLKRLNELRAEEGILANRFKREQLDSEQVAGDSNLIRAGFPPADSRVGVWSK